MYYRNWSKLLLCLNVIFEIFGVLLPMKLISIAEASKIADISDQTIRNWITNEKLQKYDVEGKMCVDKRSILEEVPAVITVFNQKGGCGKTRLSLIIGDYYENHYQKTNKNKKILLVDLDPQSNLSQSYFDSDEILNNPTLYDHFERRTALHKIVRSYNEYIDILPSKLSLEEKNYYDIDVLGEMKLTFNQFFKNYSMVIVDCPPALNSLSKFGLMLANYVVIPVMAEAFNYDGLFEVMKTIKRMQPYMNDFIDFKIIISAYNQVKSVEDFYVRLIRDEYNDKVTLSSIPDFVGIAERPIKFNNIFNEYKNSNVRLDKFRDKIYETENSKEKIEKIMQKYKIQDLQKELGEEINLITYIIKYLSSNIDSVGKLKLVIDELDELVYDQRGE